MTATREKMRVVALCGGVGGAKLALGLSSLPHVRLTVIVNTGDDFEHLGLPVSPDIDTVVYTLAGLSDQERGWGRAGESWAFMEELKRLGEEDWFMLGDRDLAMHVARANAARHGRTLTDFTMATARRLGIAAAIVPMSDDRVRTMVDTDEGLLPFQRYFVGRRCEPLLRSVRFEGAADARPSPRARDALAAGDVDAIVICPSNPYLSVDPILAVPGLRDLVRASAAPVVAVSPIVGGEAVKGPTAKIMRELGVSVTNDTIAAHYAGLIDGLLIHDGDPAPQAARLEVRTGNTLMRTDDDKARLAGEVLAFATSLAASRNGSRT